MKNNISFLRKEMRDSLIIVFFVLILSVPFINKAFHIDDTAYIYIARQVTKDPLHPYSFNFDWSGKTGLATHISNPPLISYYIAVIMLLFGRAEWVIHLSFLIFPIIAGISMFYIAKKFTNKPLASSLLFVTSIAFVVMVHTLMLDIPFIAFFLLSIALFIYGVESNKNCLLILGSIFGGMSYLIKYTGIIIIPILGTYAIVKKRFKVLIYLIIPIFFIILWNLYTFIIYGVAHNSEILNWLLKSQNSFTLQSIIIRLLTNIVYIGGATIFPLMLLYPFLIDNKNKLAYASTLIFASILSIILFFASTTFKYRYTISQLVLFAFFSSIGLFFLFIITRYYSTVFLKLFRIKNIKNVLDSKQTANNIFLVLWFLIVFLFISTLAGGAVRYITILMPPMLIIYFNMTEHYKFLNSKRLKNFIFLAVALTSLLSIAVAYADYEYANVYRNFSEVAKEYKSVNNKIWFSGHGGFQYYMQEKGYNILGFDDNSPKKGDVVVKAQIPSPRKFSPLLEERLKLLNTKSYKGNLLLRVLNPKAHAGFYTYGGGFLPYSISNSSLEDFDIYIVVK